MHLLSTHYVYGAYSLLMESEEMDETTQLWNKSEVFSNDDIKNSFDILEDNSEPNTSNYTVIVGNFVIMGIIIIMAVLFRGSKDDRSHR